MAFSVTPTSGEPPYVFNITFDNVEYFGEHYSFEFAQVNNVGECVVDYTLGENNPSNAAALLATGTTTSNSPVQNGNCRTINARIRRLSDNVLISGMSVTIDNV